MKILTNTQIKEHDKYTIEHETISSIDLMERASKAIVQFIMAYWSNLSSFVVFAGPGNNGGDALAVARLLLQEGYDVSVYLFNIHNKLTPECDTNKQRLLECKQSKNFTEVITNFDPPALTANTVVIDGLFGTGINKPLSGGFASLVKYINQSEAKVVSIDIPSGLMPEDNTNNIKSNIINAHYTLTFEQKKLSFFLADAQLHLGKVSVLNIGLSKEYLTTVHSPYELIEEEQVCKLLKHRPPFTHKGTMGHALLVAGSYGMAGAAVLATKACLRAGVGKVTTHIPPRIYDVVQTSVPEGMVSLGTGESHFLEAIDTNNYQAVGLGPGLGLAENTAIALISQIRRTQCPLVLDADALNIFGNHRAWLQQLPPKIIMTPHPKEFQQIAGTVFSNCYEQLAKAKELAEKLDAYILLKGHHSALCLPNGDVIFNSTGNAGMATAGSGDVLTGILVALLARGYKQREACIIGMYVHGLAGDIAASEIGEESLIASDIIAYLPKAFKQLYHCL